MATLYEMIASGIHCIDVTEQSSVAKHYCKLSSSVPSGGHSKRMSTVEKQQPGKKKTADGAKSTRDLEVSYKGHTSLRVVLSI